MNKDIKPSDYEVEIKESNIINEYIKSLNGYIPSNINLIGAPFLWRKGYTGDEILIAVIDTGYAKHNDLENNIIGGYNFTKEGSPDDYTDLNGHGTHCCGVMAGNGHIKGVAPNAKLLILKVLDKDGNGNLESVINAMNYAIEQGVNIISMSLGCPVNVTELYQVVKRAVNNEILVVCAAGNDGDNDANTYEYDYPAAYNEVISVGAIDNVGNSAKFTNSNKEVDLVAPGVNIISTHLNNGYISLSGTSMSVPHVTGALALLMEQFIKKRDRNPSESEMYGQLIKNTLDLGINVKIQGNGMIFLK